MNKENKNITREYLKDYFIKALEDLHYCGIEGGRYYQW